MKVPLARLVVTVNREGKAIMAFVDRLVNLALQVVPVKSVGKDSLGRLFSNLLKNI